MVGEEAVVWSVVAGSSGCSFWLVDPLRLKAYYDRSKSKVTQSSSKLYHCF